MNNPISEIISGNTQKPAEALPSAFSEQRTVQSIAIPSQANCIDCTNDEGLEDVSEDEIEDEIQPVSRWKTPFAFLRSLVSKDKKRFKDGKYDLDLSYITSNIIAMGYPSSNVEGIYRNKLSDVLSFLNTYHPHHYKVYNLCIESSRHYDISLFENRVSCYPFVDHNAPSLDQILNCCRDIHDWLTQDPENIVAIHCKAGKGRTGVMISSYLYYSHQFSTIDEALDFYADQRTYNHKGVTIPSQIRFVHYFGELVTLWDCIEKIKAEFNKQRNIEDSEITSLKGSSYSIAFSSPLISLEEYPLTVPEEYIRSRLTSIYHGHIYVLDTDVLPFNSKLYITSFKVSFGRKTRSNFSSTSALWSRYFLVLKVKIDSRNGKYFYNSKVCISGDSLCLGLYG